MPQPLLEAIKSRVLLGDGAMGTQLQAAGLPSGSCGETWNAEAPGKVLEIQKRYIQAGSDLILTNTFQGCRYPLGRHGLAERVAELNKAAAEIARQAAGTDRWVIGDIGPFGGMMEPYGDEEPDDVQAAFLEQARALVAGGVDALIVETQTALEEAECGINAARQALEEAGKLGQIPIIASMAFDKTVSGPPKTMMGVDPERAAEELDGFGADIIGCNCGTNLEIDQYEEIVRIYRATLPGKPIMAQPNAGRPEQVGDKVIYHETPELMARNIVRLAQAGANIVGGCCGTTPEHIRLFREQIDRFNASV